MNVRVRPQPAMTPRHPLCGCGSGRGAGSSKGAGQYDRAADHLAALTFGQINNRTLFGLVQLTDNELDTIVVGGVGVFVRAYRRAG